jgi:cytochrome P450/NADPH-cytochrome P450 reductase
VANDELLDATTNRSTRHVEIRIPADISYKAGDHLGVCPANPEELVHSYLELCDMDAAAMIRVRTRDVEHHQGMLPLDKPISAFAVLSYFYELQQPVGRTQLHQLSSLALDDGEKSQLLKLSSVNKKNVEEDDKEVSYEQFVLKRRLTLIELLPLFPSITIRFAQLLALLPPLKPRYYSISSAPGAKEGASVASITVSVVKGASPTGRLHQGVASTFLKSNLVGRPRPLPVAAGKTMPLYVFVKDTGSSFRLPEDTTTPIIMIGPGTGVAPMRGFLQQRAMEGGSGENVLFYGCRNDADYVYRDELEDMVQEGVLDKLCVAFSRKQDQGVKKTYVQDMIAAESTMLRGLLQRGAHVYVCGDASQMAPAVKQAFVQILADGGDNQAEDTVLDMCTKGRYCEDVWAAQGSC